MVQFASHIVFLCLHIASNAVCACMLLGVPVRHRPFIVCRWGVSNHRCGRGGHSGILLESDARRFLCRRCRRSNNNHHHPCQGQRTAAGGTGAHSMAGSETLRRAFLERVATILAPLASNKCFRMATTCKHPCKHPCNFHQRCNLPVVRARFQAKYYQHAPIRSRPLIHRIPHRGLRTKTFPKDLAGNDTAHDGLTEKFELSYGGGRTVSTPLDATAGTEDPRGGEC